MKFVPRIDCLEARRLLSGDQPPFIDPLEPGALVPDPPAYVDPLEPGVPIPEFGPINSLPGDYGPTNPGLC